MYTFWALVPCGDVDGFSMDAIIGLSDPKAADSQTFAVWRTGYGRQIVVIVSCFTFFAGGVSKLRESGLKWMDGKTLQYHLNRAQVAWAPKFAAWMAERLWVCKLLSIQTIIYETTCYAAIISPKLRLAVFVQAVGLHLGIAMTMKPKFWPQAWCYSLAFELIPGKGVPEVLPDTSIGGIILAAGTWLTLSLMIYIGYTGLEAWPFTSVPMYAQYKEIGYDRYPKNKKEIAQIRNWNSCRCWGMQFSRIIVATTIPGEPKEFRSLFFLLVDTGNLPLHTRTQYLRAVWEATIDYARSKESNAVQRLLDNFAIWLRDHPDVLGEGKHVLRMKLRLRKQGDIRQKRNSVKDTSSTREQKVVSVTVKGAGIKEANGEYKISTKTDGTPRRRDGVSIYRRLIKPKREARNQSLNLKEVKEGKNTKMKRGGRSANPVNGTVRFTICRAKVTTTDEHKWWLFRNERAGDKWTKDIDLYNALADISSQFPPDAGWKNLANGKSPAPTIHITRDLEANVKTDDKEKDYQLGTIGTSEVPPCIKNT
eukprot:CAMPEP_0114534182 /NCGR_PEP_ID=MMETSP0109-20121206/27701_1 /TAXON_ID=29199 /ORGANISM="Chlorarachnion reptans, Strain CCCM449" /LENGTH=536 /DNA_ID=CAMNT_0001717573 /DNA_START=337 /DNA_END=1947 /DNA_ORIENTATION=+